MFAKLSRLIRGPEPQTSDPMRRHLAMAVLLVETARADFDDHGAERAAMRDLLADALRLDPAEAEALVDKAFATSHQSVSLHSFLQTLNGELDPAGKRELLEWLWRVAFADGRLDPQEEARIRQLADLLFVPHADFVQLRHKVEQEQHG